MTEFKGTKYQLAGFKLHQKNGLVEVFAKFCGINDEPKLEVELSVNSIALAEFHEESAAAELACPKPVREPGQSRTGADILAGLSGIKLPSGPYVSVDDVVVLLGAKPNEDDTRGMGRFRLPGPQKEELLEDLGSEKLGLLLVEMGKARANYLAGTETFIPLAKLNKV